MAFFGFIWSLFKYPIPTIIGVNLIALMFFPNSFGNIFAVSVVVGLIYYFAKQPDQNNTKSQQPPKQERQKRESSKETFTKNELHKVYLDLAKKYHPDHAQGEQDKKFRTELFKKIHTAYVNGDMETLKMYQFE